MSFMYTIFWVGFVASILVSIYFINKTKKKQGELSKLKNEFIQTKDEFVRVNELKNNELNAAILEQRESLKQYMDEKKDFSDTVLRYQELIGENKVEQKVAYDKLLGQKKSSEVRVGKIGENMAPFLNGWPYDPNNFRFLGNPIDGVQFNEDELIFIEIKTGRSALSKKQKWIKQLIKEGKVGFATFRINEKGVVFTKEEI